MAETVRTKIYWDRVYAMNLRVDGKARQVVRDVSRKIVRQARLNVKTGSRARHRGYPRTGHLARSISDAHSWANQHGNGRTVSASAAYAKFVHEGTRARITRPGGGKMAVGREQGSTTMYLRTVRGQRGNPFLEDAARSVMRREF